MGETTAISWCDHTFNAWIGCTKVSPGCEHCYAERQNRFYHWTDQWGPAGTRKFTSDENWHKPLAWNKAAAKAGVRPRVFCGSLMDVFEDRPELVVPRYRLFDLIEDTPHLDWLLLTKRPENILKLTGWWDVIRPHNIWIGTTTENQEQADKRIPLLLQVPAVVRFVSCEPLLGPVDLTAGIHSFPADAIKHEDWRKVWPDWVIAGGESGPNARPMHPDWARSLRDQCQGAGARFFFKQWGEWLPWEPAAQQPFWRSQAGHFEDGHRLTMIDPETGDDARGWDTALYMAGQGWGDVAFQRVGKRAAGDLLDGRQWHEFPEARP